MNSRTLLYTLLCSLSLGGTLSLVGMTENCSEHTKKYLGLYSPSAYVGGIPDEASPEERFAQIRKKTPRGWEPFVGTLEQYKSQARQLCAVKELFKKFFLYPYIEKEIKLIPAEKRTIRPEQHFLLFRHKNQQEPELVMETVKHGDTVALCVVIPRVNLITEYEGIEDRTRAILNRIEEDARLYITRHVYKKYPELAKAMLSHITR
jgi:hypothetical protein